MNERIQQALAFFVAQGWAPHQSAGIVANLRAESGMRFDAVGDGGKAYGIAQWHPPRQSNFAGLFGKPIQQSTFEEQLHFVHAELQGTEKAAGDKLAACTTAAQAGACVSEFYERPADRVGEATKRATLAARLFQDYSATLAAQAGAGEAIPPQPIPIPQPDLPQPQPEKPMGPLMFLPAILQMIPQLLKVPGLSAASNVTPTQLPSGLPQKVTDYLPLIQTIVETFTRAVPGAINTQQAVEIAQGNPKVAATAAQAVLAAPDIVDELNRLAPVLDRIHKYEQDSWVAEEESRNAAASRAIEQQREGPLLNNPTFLLAVLVMALVCTVVIAVLFKGGFSTDMQAFVIGAVVGSALTAVLSFYFGSSRGSSAKDATISRLATNK